MFNKNGLSLKKLNGIKAFVQKLLEYYREECNRRGLVVFVDNTFLVQKEQWIYDKASCKSHAIKKQTEKNLPGFVKVHHSETYSKSGNVSSIENQQRGDLMYSFHWNNEFESLVLQAIATDVSNVEFYPKSSLQQHKSSNKSVMVLNFRLNKVLLEKYYCDELIYSDTIGTGHNTIIENIARTFGISQQHAAKMYVMYGSVFLDKSLTDLFIDVKLNEFHVNEVPYAQLCSLIQEGYIDMLKKVSARLSSKKVSPECDRIMVSGKNISQKVPQLVSLFFNTECNQVVDAFDFSYNELVSFVPATKELPIMTSAEVEICENIIPEPRKSSFQKKSLRVINAIMNEIREFMTEPEAEFIS